MKTLILAFAILGSVSAAFAQKPKVTIYNPQADAKATLAAAVKKASAERKHVFVQVGGNWCSWCIAFHNMVDTTASVKKLMQDHYETVLVNYSPENKNEAALASLGYPQRFGFPVFVILDGTGKVLHIQNSAYLETDELGTNGKKRVAHNPKEVADFLSNWTYKAVSPESYKASK